jgi:hypothetical protein
MPLPGLPDMANELVLAQRIRSEAPNAMSPRGARRLIQIMPAAAMASGPLLLASIRGVRPSLSRSATAFLPEASMAAFV